MQWILLNEVHETEPHQAQIEFYFRLDGAKQEWTRDRSMTVVYARWKRETQREIYSKPSIFNVGLFIRSDRI